MANWVIRQVSTGLFWSNRHAQGATGRWRPFDVAMVFCQERHDENLAAGPCRLVDLGEEWVELDDAGQPVEAAKPVRMWVTRERATGRFFCGGIHQWDPLSKETIRYPEPHTYSPSQWEDIPVLVHPDGAVTLDEPAPSLPDLTASPSARVLTGTSGGEPAPTTDESDAKPRAPGCECHQEEGDSPCRVHGEDEPAPVAQGANAGPVVGWAITDGKGFYERGTGNFVHDLELAASWPCKQHVWSSGQTSVPFGHRDDGSRFLLPTAPAVAQPSPYSESADEPIPYRLAAPTSDEPIPVTTAELITAECNAIAAMLRAKNEAYGDSALSPVRVFSRADSVEQIKVRIDDKLSRLARGSGTETEDVVSDLLGYLVLLRIAQRKAAA